MEDNKRKKWKWRKNNKRKKGKRKNRTIKERKNIKGKKGWKNNKERKNNKRKKAEASEGERLLWDSAIQVPFSAQPRNNKLVGGILLVATKKRATSISRKIFPSLCLQIDRSRHLLDQIQSGFYTLPSEQKGYVARLNWSYDSFQICYSTTQFMQPQDGNFSYKTSAQERVDCKCPLRQR